MQVASSVEWTRIRTGIKQGLTVRIDGRVRDLRSLGRAVDELGLPATWYMGDEHGVLAYDKTQRSDGTALFVIPASPPANCTGDDA